MIPKVSICCITYNHAPYIAQTIEGFLMQKVNFPFEILIHDDASTDGTDEIIRIYERKYSDIIKPIYQNENQFSQGIKVSFTYQFPRARGKYIALCEGDDHWTDQKKLMKQVEFMEQNPNLSMSFHAARIDYADVKKRSSVHRYKGNHILDPKKVILCGGKLYPTCSAMFKREVVDDYPSFFLSSPVGDSMLLLNALRKGDIGYIDEIMAVYKSGIPGSWSEKTVKESLLTKLERTLNVENIRNQFDSYTGYKFTNTIKEKNSSDILFVLRAVARMRQWDKNYEALKKRLMFKHRCALQLLVLYYWLKHKYHRCVS